MAVDLLCLKVCLLQGLSIVFFYKCHIRTGIVKNCNPGQIVCFITVILKIKNIFQTIKDRAIFYSFFTAQDSF